MSVAGEPLAGRAANAPVCPGSGSVPGSTSEKDQSGMRPRMMFFTPNDRSSVVRKRPQRAHRPECVTTTTTVVWVKRERDRKGTGCASGSPVLVGILAPPPRARACVCSRMKTDQQPRG